MERCKRENDRTVASIFINPTQFNNAADLEKYPRTTEKDILKLLRGGNDVLYLPEADDIYHKGVESSKVDLGNLDKSMEGSSRPGHFEGVVQVVELLLRIVEPHKLYLGQKDYQQYIIVREMIRQLDLKVETVLCPTHREADGFAMSSRNVRLSEQQRAQAPVIIETLNYIKENAFQLDLTKIKAFADQKLSSNPEVSEVEYIDVVDSQTLTPLDKLTKGTEAIVCIAVRMGEVRLMDNTIIS